MPKERILVVDDEEDILELLTFNLEKEGYVVAGADDGEKGLQAAGTEQPDLILLDLNLPRMDGREVLGSIKQDDDLRRIPVVILTVSSDEADVRLSSTGSTTIWVQDSLKADLSSTGNLRYRGDPTVNASTSSSGEVIQIGE